MLKGNGLYAVLGVLAGLVAYQAWVMYNIHKDHQQEYDTLYGQYTSKYRNMALLVAVVVGVAVAYFAKQMSKKSK